MAKKSSKFEKSIVTIISEFDSVKLDRDVARSEASALYDALKVAVSRVDDLTADAPTEATEQHRQWATFAKEQFALEE